MRTSSTSIRMRADPRIAFQLSITCSSTRAAEAGAGRVGWEQQAGVFDKDRQRSRSRPAHQWQGTGEAAAGCGPSPLAAPRCSRTAGGCTGRAPPCPTPRTWRPGCRSAGADTSQGRPGGRAGGSGGLTKLAALSAAWGGVQLAPRRTVHWQRRGEPCMPMPAASCQPHQVAYAHATCQLRAPGGPPGKPCRSARWPPPPPAGCQTGAACARGEQTPAKPRFQHWFSFCQNQCCRTVVCCSRAR